MSKPKCENCGEEISFLESAFGETWGGFAEVDGDPGGWSDQDNKYRGRWYWEYWVYMPRTHAIRYRDDGDDERVEA